MSGQRMRWRSRALTIGGQSRISRVFDPDTDKAQNVADELWQIIAKLNAIRLQLTTICCREEWKPAMKR